MTQQESPPDAPRDAAAAPEADGRVPTGGAQAVRRWHWVALVGILLLAAGLRVHHLGAESLWIDELLMLQYSAGNCWADHALPRDRVLPELPRTAGLDTAAPVWRIPFTLRDDQHPPLYYVLLRFWREAFGSSDAALRSLSVAASLAGIVLLFELGRLLAGPAVALWACLLMALTQPQIWYAQEARSYALLAAMVLGAAVALVRIERLGFNRRRAAALGACLLGTMFTHYFGAAGCVALGLYALVRLRGTTRLRVVGVMAASAATYMILWGPFLWQQTHGNAVGDGIGWLRDGGPGFAWRWFDRLLLAPFRLFARPMGPDRAMAKVLGVVLVLTFVLPRRRAALLPPALCASFVIALPAALDWARGTQQLEYERYYLAAGPFVYLILAGLLEDVRRPRFARYLLPAAMALYCVLSLPWVYATQKFDWRSYAMTAARSAGPRDVIAFYSPRFASWYAGVQLLAIEHYAPQTNNRVLLLNGPASADTLAALADAPTVLLASDSINFDAKQILPGFRPVRQEYVWGVGYLIELRHDVLEGTQ